MSGSSNKQWYALRVFKNRLRYVKSQVEEAGNETYQALKTVDVFNGGSLKYKVVPLIPSLLFVRVTSAYINQLKKERYDHLLVYGTPEGIPEPISDAQMDVFILVTSPGGGCKISVLEDGMEQYKKGDPVRVIDGYYKGATGVVRRIKKDRKLLVAIEGVTVVALSNIPLEFLEKI